jgi:hypothetical protein
VGAYSKVDVVKTGFTTSQAPGYPRSSTASCKPGWTLVGGGGAIVNGQGAATKDVFVSGSAPLDSNNNVWQITAFNGGTTDATFDLWTYAICVQ